MAGFNPLHCGAVVASRRAANRRVDAAGVSIPFIAGQWSLPTSPQGGGAKEKKVSIPFIAGQWSLPLVREHLSFLEAACFNPLHCGAVVASKIT